MVIAAQSWHWVDPVAGAVKAAQVLRPSGRLAIFGHVYEPPVEVAKPFAAVYRRVVPDSPFANLPARRPLDMYQAMFAKFAGTIRESEQFHEPEQWRFDWEQSCTRDQWLALLPTTGGLTRLRPGQLADILDAVGTAIDALGGAFMMYYTTLAVTAAHVRASCLLTRVWQGRLRPGCECRVMSRFQQVAAALPRLLVRGSRPAADGQSLGLAPGQACPGALGAALRLVSGQGGEDPDRALAGEGVS